MKRYLETRTQSSTSSTAAADLARHLLSRQHLGKVVVICDKPQIVVSVVRKYWLKLSRQLQKERASTLNAEKILQLTHDITHMQHMSFVAKPSDDNLRGDVFFVTPTELRHIPTHCFSVYVLEAPKAEALRNAIARLPNHALVVDYTRAPVLQAMPLLPKFQLDQTLPDAWQRVEQFLERQRIDVRELAENIHRADLIDEAIDVILNTSSQFLRLSDDFLELLRLAQPVNVPNSQQQLYDLLSILNRRIYALTPGTLSQQFIQSLSDDGLSFHDPATENLALALTM